MYINSEAIPNIDQNSKTLLGEFIILLVWKNTATNYKSPLEIDKILKDIAPLIKKEYQENIENIILNNRENNREVLISFSGWLKKVLITQLRI